MRKSVLFKVWMPMCALCALCAVLRSAAASAAHTARTAGDTVISWGIKYGARERTPEPPPRGVKLLEENNGVFVRRTEEKKVYFTFDLGYEAGYTSKVLDILGENGIKGIFFLCGNYLKEKELISRIAAEGHEIGNHTDRHKDLPLLSEELLKKDITDFQEKFKAGYPQTPIRFFRPPQGRFDEKTLRAASAEGLRTVLWSIAIADWGKTPLSAAACAQKIADRLHPGAVILLHITNPAAPEILKQLLPKMAAKNYSAGSPLEL